MNSNKVLKRAGSQASPTGTHRPPTGTHRPPTGTHRPPTGFHQSPSSNRVISKDEVKAQNTAQELIQRAQAEAEMIRAQAVEFRQRAYDEGYSEGLEQGKQELVSTILQMNRENDERFSVIEEEIVKLAIHVSQKIINRELTSAPDVVVSLVTKALGAVRHQTQIFLRVSTDDFETIQEHKPQLLELLSRAQDIDIRSDSSISQGSCRIESELGIIDAQLEKQLSMLEQILLGQQ
ncbi:MAG: type III secretion system stator protein SctL [Myxococcota bacterium]